MIPQLQYIVDRYGVKTMPELLGYLQLDRLLSADGPLIDGIMSAGTKILLGAIVGPASVQKIPWSKDFDQQLRPQQQVVKHQAKTTRMSMMGRPVRTESLHFIHLQPTTSRSRFFLFFTLFAYDHYTICNVHVFVYYYTICYFQQFYVQHLTYDNHAYAFFSRPRALWPQSRCLFVVIA